MNFKLEKKIPAKLEGSWEGSMYSEIQDIVQKFESLLELYKSNPASFLGIHIPSYPTIKDLNDDLNKLLVICIKENSPTFNLMQKAQNKQLREVTTLDCPEFSTTWAHSRGSSVELEKQITVVGDDSEQKEAMTYFLVRRNYKLKGQIDTLRYDLFWLSPSKPTTSPKLKKALFLFQDQVSFVIVHPYGKIPEEHLSTNDPVRFFHQLNPLQAQQFVMMNQMKPQFNPILRPSFNNPMIQSMNNNTTSNSISFKLPLPQQYQLLEPMLQPQVKESSVIRLPPSNNSQGMPQVSKQQTTTILPFTKPPLGVSESQFNIQETAVEERVGQVEPETIDEDTTFVIDFNQANLMSMLKRVPVSSIEIPKITVGKRKIKDTEQVIKVPGLKEKKKKLTEYDYTFECTVCRQKFEETFSIENYSQKIKSYRCRTHREETPIEYIGSVCVCPECHIDSEITEGEIFGDAIFCIGCSNENTAWWHSGCAGIEENSSLASNISFICRFCKEKVKSYTVKETITNGYLVLEKGSE